MKNLVCNYDLHQRNEDESIQLVISLLGDYSFDLENEYLEMMDNGKEFTFEDVFEDLQQVAMENVGHSVGLDEGQLIILDESNA
jgi:hypothetical protein